MDLTLALAGLAVGLAWLSGLVGFAAPGPARAQRWAASLMGSGAAAALVAAALALRRQAPGTAPFGGWLGGGALRLDGLSAFFLVPVFGIGALASLYGLGDYPASELGGKARRWQLFHGLVIGAMGLILLADDARLFLVAWEAMALAGFALVLVDDERAEAQRAAFVYLAATHVATLALFGLFALLAQAAGSFSFAALAGQVPRSDWLLLLLGLGFGVKAGAMPLHFWLPDAHAAAPSHVSAILSGLVLKMGIYGILRVSGLLAAPASWGWAVLATGTVSAVLGVVFALAQHDLKRLLAYHSVENIGIILMGIGLALLGRAAGEPVLVAFGLGGAIFHVLNHATFKSLLFFGAGAVHHATGSRQMDRLGGLARRMPATALCFLVGAAAISGLPPLNGFASELLLYLGLGQALASRSAVAFAGLAAAALALVGGLAAACFAKAFGVVFLGSPRGPSAAEAHEAKATVRLAMAALAAACVVLGVFPEAIRGALRSAVLAWDRRPGALPPPWAPPSAALGWLGLAGPLLLLSLLLVWAARRGAGRAPAPAVATWGCGFPAPTPRMQYTSASFADLLLRALPWPLVRQEATELPAAPFPAQGRFSSHASDPVIDLGLTRAAGAFAALAGRLRRLQRPSLHANALVLLLVLIALLAWRLPW
ncbi:MAG: proton-conducting transporter transmembrane domain-containing protein [Myxococcales bacterium]